MVLHILYLKIAEKKALKKRFAQNKKNEIILK